MKRVVLFLLVGIVVAACEDDPTGTILEPGPPVAQILDAIHNEGNEHFFFLPPLVPNPAASGVFDATLAPVVEICEWTESACTLPLLAEFTTTTGPGSETVRLVAEEEHYIVNWHTNEFELDDLKTYRIRVLAGGTKLGHADVDVVSSGSQLKNVDTDEFIALKDGPSISLASDSP